MVGVAITGISYYLPEEVLTNEQLEAHYKDWSADKILDKTGIRTRHIASEHQCASDLAEMAALKLIESNHIDPKTIDFVILATQSPDYLLPTTACILQHKLGLPTHAGALDFNLGCSAYIYGLALAKSLIKTEIASKILLIMSETYTKHIHPLDRTTRTIFGDGAAATLVSRDDVDKIGDFILNTDGSGAPNLIIPASGMRLKKSDKTKEVTKDENGAVRTDENIYMNGPEIFNFTIKTIPKTVVEVLEKNKISMDQIDLFVFHQANKFMLDYLRKKIKIPSEKFYVNLENTGNTVSASIPIALKMAFDDGVLKKGHRVMLVGFGVGLSWGATIIEF